MIVVEFSVVTVVQVVFNSAEVFVCDSVVTGVVLPVVDFLVPRVVATGK